MNDSLDVLLCVVSSDGSPTSFLRGWPNLRLFPSLESLAAELSVKQPDAIVVEFDGLTTEQQVNQISLIKPYSNGTPVLVVSSRDSPEAAIEAAKAGVETYLLRSEISPVVLDKAVRFAVERHQLLKQLDEERARLQHINRELERFAYVASHDLQEPLRTVSSYIQLFAKRYSQNLDAEGKKYVDYILTANLRMRKLVQDLLDYSRANNSRLDFEEVSLHDLIMDVVNAMTMKIHEAKAEVKVENINQTLVCDRIQIGRVLMNFISNALKFSSRDRKPSLKIDAEERDGMVVVSCRDNGRGIRSEDLEHIFGMFERGRVLPGESQKGNGMGLAICKKIVERHGGRVWVESKLNEGSVFSFSLPKTRLSDDGSNDQNHVS